MIEKKHKSISSNMVLIFAGIIIAVLVIAAVFFLMAKNGNSKETAQYKNNEQSEKVSQNNKDISKDNEADAGVKYIFLPTLEKTYDLNGKPTGNYSSYYWEYYKSPTDYKLIYSQSNGQQMNIKNIMERKHNKLKSSTDFYINNNLQQDLSSKTSMEFFDNTSIILNQETTKLNGETSSNTIEVVKNQKVGNLIMLELYDNSTNTLKKIQINPNGVVTERLYENDELGSLKEYKNYYYNGVLVTTLYDVEYYQDNKLYSTASYKVEKEEVVDENNVKITLVSERERNGKKIKEFTIEYGLQKYIVENDGTVTPIDMEE